MTALDTKALLTGVTPGPWLDAVSDTHDGRLAIWADGGLAGVTQVAVLPPEFKAVKANARLIASAPRLARRVIALEEALAEARPVVEAMTGTEWAGVGKFNCWQKADDSLRAIKAKIEAALKGEGDE